MEIHCTYVKVLRVVLYYLFDIETGTLWLNELFNFIRLIKVTQVKRSNELNLLRLGLLVAVETLG